MYEFQPPDLEEEPDDEKRERWFAEKEKNGYAVLSRDEWRDMLDQAQRDAYAEGRKDEREEAISLLKEEAASIRSQGDGCRDGRYDWMAAGIEAAADAFGGIDSATGKPATPELMKALTKPAAEVMWSDPLALHGKIKWLGKPAPLGSLLYSS